MIRARVSRIFLLESRAIPGPPKGVRRPLQKGSRTCRVAARLTSLRRAGRCYTALPTKAPIPAVKAIASAPQKTTLIVGRRIAAPPVLAPIMPSNPRKTNEPIETTGSNQGDGETSVRTRGAAAPREKVAAEAKAACTGRAVLISEIPSSSRAWAPNASFAISCSATLRARPSSTPRAE